MYYLFNTFCLLYIFCGLLHVYIDEEIDKCIFQFGTC